jgi:hypothetical protein
MGPGGPQAAPRGPKVEAGGIAGEWASPPRRGGQPSAARGYPKGAVSCPGPAGLIARGSMPAQRNS